MSLTISATLLQVARMSEAELRQRFTGRLLAVTQEGLPGAAEVQGLERRKHG